MAFLIEGFPKIFLFPENGPILGFGKVYKVYFYFLLRLTQTINPSYPLIIQTEDYNQRILYFRPDCIPFSK